MGRSYDQPQIVVLPFSTPHDSYDVKDSNIAPTTEALRTVIGDAEKAIRACSSLFEGAIEKGNSDLILSFQPRLARAIYSLEAEVLKFKRAKQELIATKSAHPRDSLSEKFKRLNDAIDALERVIDFGLIVGEAFAWMFYRTESHLVSRHLARQRISHLPVGTGGMGEIEFVTQSPVIGGHLVLYHGITTFLRLGDVSFLNPKTGKIDGIAELKTQRVAEDQLNVAVNYIGKKLDLPLPKTVPRNQTRHSPIDPKFHTILQRQIKEIQRAMGSHSSSSTSLSQNGGRLVFSPQCLDALYDATTIEKAADIQVSPGLVLAGLKAAPSSMAERLLNPSPTPHSDLLAGVPHEVKKIAVSGAPDNSIQIGTLIFPRGGRYSLEHGMKPLPWWGIRNDVRNAMMDDTFRVISFFNPAPLCARLREQGYDVKCRRPGRGFSLEAKINGRDFPFLGLDHLFQMIPRQLIDEQSVFNMICRLVENVGLKHADADGLIRMELLFRDLEAGEQS